MGNIHFLRQEIESGRSEWAYIPGYSMYVDTLTKSLPTSKKAQQIPILLGESPETLSFVTEVLNRPRSRYRKQLEDELIDPEAIGSISELIDEDEGIEGNNQDFLAFDNAELNAVGEKEFKKFSKPPTNYMRIHKAIDEDWRFKEIIEECQDNVDYHLISNPNIIVKSVSWGDDYEGQDLIMGNSPDEAIESSDVIPNLVIQNVDSKLTYQQKRNQKQRKRYKATHG